MNMPYRMTDARGMLVSLLDVSSRDAQDELGLVPKTLVRWDGSVPSSPMSPMQTQKDVFSAMLEPICCTW